MKKLFLVCALALGTFAISFAETVIVIETSCGVEVTMIYQDHHTVADVLNDAEILQEYFCGE